MLQRLKKNFGLSIVVSTPYMDEAVQCDRIALIQDGAFLTIDTPQGIVDKYSETLWAVRSNKMHQLLTDLRSTDGVKTAFAFGETHHATINTEILSQEELYKILQQKGHSQITIGQEFPSIEECFMNLQK